MRDLEGRIVQLEKAVALQQAEHREPARLEFAGGNLDGAWTRIGNWSDAKRARAFAVYSDALYVGIDGGHEGRAAIYKQDDDGWRLAGGRGSGFRHGTEVHTAYAYGGLLYCGISSTDQGAQLWRTDGQNWERVGHWQNYFSVSALAAHNGRLIVALVSRDKQDTSAPILAYDGAWTEVVSGLGPYLCAYHLIDHQGSLYAAMLSHGWPGGHILRINGNWELIGGDGRNASWNYLSEATRLCSVGPHLVALFNRIPATQGAFYNAWAFDGDSWAPLPQFPAETLSLYSFNAMMPYRGHLIVGAGGRPAGRATILALGNDGWQQIGGKGVQNSWSPPRYRRQNEPMTYPSATEYPYRMCEHRGDLIAGFGASIGSAQVWRFRPDLQTIQ